MKSMSIERILDSVTMLERYEMPFGIGGEGDFTEYPDTTID